MNMNETEAAKYDMAWKLIEQDIAWLHDESDPTVINDWLEQMLLEGFVGYINHTEEELRDELAMREDPIDDDCEPNTTEGK
jgi:hypothetical protein